MAQITQFRELSEHDRYCLIRPRPLRKPRTSELLSVLAATASSHLKVCSGAPQGRAGTTARDYPPRSTGASVRRSTPGGPDRCGEHQGLDQIMNIAGGRLRYCRHMNIDAETIETDRLVLRPLAADHADEMAVVLADPALHTFTGGSPVAASALRDRYERMLTGSPDPAVSWWQLGDRTTCRRPPRRHGAGDDQPVRPRARRRDRLGGGRAVATTWHCR